MNIADLNEWVSKKNSEDNISKNKDIKDAEEIIIEKTSENAQNDAPMATYSHSRISSFEQCRLKFRYSYIDKVKTDVVRTIETYMGDLVHQTLEKLYKDLKFEKLNELKDLIEFYNNLWKENWEEGILIVKKEYNQENYCAMGERMIKDYYNHYKPFNQAKTIGLETTDYFELDKNHRIHVRIDRLSSPEEGVYEIHDYKTNSSMKTQEEADTDRQLAVYAMGVKKLYPDAKRVKLIWHMLAFDKEVISERTDEQLDELKISILNQINVIETATKYEPTKSGLCPYCEYQSLCPLWKHLFQIKDKPEKEFTKDDGVKMVEKYAEIKEKEKKLSKELEELSNNIKLYGEKIGAKTLFGKKSAITIWSKEVMKFPRKTDVERTKLIKALKGLNLYEKFLDIDNWELEKGYDNLSEIEKEVLKQIGRKEKLVRLYLRERK